MVKPFIPKKKESKVESKIHAQLEKITKHIGNAKKLFNMQELYELMFAHKISPSTVSIMRYFIEYETGHMDKTGYLLFRLGAFDHQHVAGNSPYNPKQTVWMNELQSMCCSLQCLLNEVDF